jgi:outer membrane protein assembly factor BamB
MNKNKPFFAVILVLILTIAAFMAVAPAVKAADVTTQAFLSVSPNPTGVDEQVIIVVWVQPVAPTAFDKLHGYTVTITDPDGTKETQGPVNPDPTGSTYVLYTPTKTGNYSLQLTYPGETFASTGDHYISSTSPVTTLVVQQQPTQQWPETPLPTYYWSRPINAQNRLWASISGDWLLRSYNATYSMSTSDAAIGFNPYSQAANSSHVMWTKELALGGTVGGVIGDTSYYTGLTYEEKLAPPIIMDGKIYYNIYPSDFGSAAGIQGEFPGFVCVDLRTGQELWRNTNGVIDAGQEYNFVSGNQMGALPYLWDLAIPGTFASMMGLIPRLEYKMYDANTGTLIATFQHAMPAGNSPPVPGMVLSSLIVEGSDGTIYIYFLDGLHNWLAMWNSTKALVGAGMIPVMAGGEQLFLRNKPGTYEWGLGIQWNVTIPARQITAAGVGTIGPSFFNGGVTNDVLIATTGTFSKFYYHVGYDMNTGEELWVRNATLTSIFHACGEGVFAVFDTVTMTWVGLDAKTGNQLWVSDPADYPWGSFTNAAAIAYGKLYTLSYDGSVHAYDIKTGKQVWKFYSGDDIYALTPYGHYPFYYGPIIAGGVVYAGNGEHSPSEPLERGERLFAIDASTGEGLWNTSGLMVIQAIADGYLVGYNGYDNQMYVFGKGPSATTITATPKVSVHGNSVLVEGVVTDISPGTEQYAQTARFPNGVPAISDQSMSSWMEYVYQQQPMPTDAKGVNVTVSVLDPNNNCYDVGTTTSDASGFFKLSFTPQVPGEYTVIASFAGSDSYYGSTAETALAVNEAPAATPAPTPSPASLADIYFLPMSIVILIAIIVATIVMVLMLRKR